MAKKDEEKVMLAEHVLEIRHAASGSFLDIRGYVADYIRKSGLFPHWKIDTNVVNFRDSADKVQKDGAFAGYKNAGYIVLNPETRNYFPEKAISFWKTLIKNEYYTVPDAERFGARTKIYIPTKRSFEEINDVVFNTLYTEKAKKIIGGKETDVQFVIELIEDKFDVRVSGGPMHENEAGKHMSFESDHFKSCGFFIDLDYYKTKDIPHDDIPKLLKKAIELTWTKVETIASELGI